MCIARLIYGDYLIFTIGNLIADFGIALFALLSWKSQELKNDIDQFLLSLEKRGILSDPKLFEAKSAFLRPEDANINGLGLSQDLLKDFNIFFYKHKKYRTYNVYIIYLFFFGVLIQLIGIFSTRLI